MDYQKAIQEVNNGKLYPVYLLGGSESFLRQSFIDLLLNQIGEAEAIETVRFDFNDISLSEILDEAEMFSFFADQRVIIVNHFELLTPKANNKISDNEQERLLSYIKDPNEATHLVFVQEQDKMDKRKKITKAFQKSIPIIDVQPLEDQQVQNYVQGYLNDIGLKITKEGLLELLQRVNYQLSQAISEIAKLKIYTQDKQTINIEMVRSLVPRTLESDVFELSNAVMAKEVNQAAQIYQDLILLKNEPIALHALIVSQFRLVLQVKILAQKGLFEGDIAKQLGVHPYRVKLANKSGRLMSLEDLSNFYQELVIADWQMKTGEGSKDTHFYLLLTKMMQIS